MNGGIPPTDLAWLRAFIHDATAIALHPNKDYLVLSRLAPVARERELSGLPHLVRALRAQPDGDLARAVIEAMATHETSWFRDRNVFESLRRHTLPRIIARRRATRRLRIWSAGCSSGQEPYSLAMMLNDDFPELRTWEIDLVGTDISEAILDRARQGVYSEAEMGRGLTAADCTQHFRRDATEWVLAEAIRRRVRFRHLNLAGPWWGLRGPFDLILLRNVLIYFDLPTRREVLDRTCERLDPDGYLILGTSETTLNLTERLVRTTTGRAGAYRLASTDPSPDEDR